MKKKICYCFTLICIIFLMFCNSSKAETLVLNVISDKDKIDVGDEITVTVDWKQKMQAADFVLNYNQDKFEFIGSDIEETFYKADTSKVKVVWVSIDDTDKTKISFKFKALRSGNAKFSATVDGGFATGTLAIPESYKMGDTMVVVNKTIAEKIGAIAIGVVVVAIVFGIILTRKKW